MQRTPPSDAVLAAALARAATQAGVLSRADALDCGMTAAQLVTLLRRDEWIAVGRGCVAPVPSTSDEQEAGLQVAAAVRRRLPGGPVASWPDHLVATGSAAARVLGLPLLVSDTAVELVDRRTRGPSSALAQADVVRRRGVLVTSPARTAVDLARRRGLLSGVVAADAAMRRFGTARADLLAVAARGPRLDGNAAARRAADLARRTSESPLESLGRAQLVLLGFPEPEGQVEVEDEQGLIGRVDHVWAARRVIAEADGRGKYDEPSALWKEKLREDRLRAGFELFRYTWVEAFHDPAALGAKAEAAFARAARRFG